MFAGRRRPPAERAVIVLVADQQHEAPLAALERDARDFLGQQLAGAAAAEIGVRRERPEQVAVDAADADRCHPHRTAALSVDLADHREALVDREALAHAERGAGEASRPEGERLQVVDELVVIGGGEADGGQPKLRRRGLYGRSCSSSDHMRESPGNSEHSEAQPAARGRHRPTRVVGSPDRLSPSWTPPQRRNRA